MCHVCNGVNAVFYFLVNQFLVSSEIDWIENVLDFFFKKGMRGGFDER